MDEICYILVVKDGDYKECFFGVCVLLGGDKKGKGKIGIENIRKFFIVVFVVVRNVKSKEELKICFEYNFKESLEVFLKYLFVSLYWKNKLIFFMIEVFVEEVVIKFVDVIDCDNFDFFDWAEFCVIILEEIMVKYCYIKFLGKDISEVG